MEDNGAGISKATIDMVISNNSKRKVFGLKNIVDRLELYYETSGNDIDNEGKTREAILSYDRKFRDNLYIVSKHLAIQSNYKFTRVFLILTKV